jgi:hypothetical protein
MMRIILDGFTLKMVFGEQNNSVLWPYMSNHHIMLHKFSISILASNIFRLIEF